MSARKSLRAVIGCTLITVVYALDVSPAQAQDEFDAIFGSIEAQEEVPVVTEKKQEKVEALKEPSTPKNAKIPDTADINPVEESTIQPSQGEIISNQEPTASGNEAIVEKVDVDNKVSQPMPEGKALIFGKVLDAETGQPVERATVFLDDTDFLAISNVVGAYRIESVPAGNYDIVFSKAGYRNSRIRGFAVADRQSVEANFPLPPLPPETSDEVFDLGEYAVTVAELQDALMAIQELRLDNVGSIDVLSSEDFSKFAASDVAEAIVRVPGVSIADGKFAVIRGLSDRYSNTLLNGLPLPSPDPDRQSVQLDIFPSKFLSNLVVSKAYSAAQPGNSASGSIDLNTKVFVDERVLNLSIGAGFDEAALDNDFRTFATDGKGHRWADGASDVRSIPSPDSFIIPLLPDETFISQKKSFTPDHSISFEYGETFDVTDNQKVSILLSGNTSRKYRVSEGTYGDYGVTNAQIFTPPFFFSSTRTFAQTEQYPAYTEFQDEASLGGIASVGYQLQENFKLSALALFNRVAVQKVAFGENGTVLNSITNGNRSEVQNVTREELYYNQRQLTSFQLNGSAQLQISDYFSPELAFGLSHSEASQEEPDFRLHVYYEDNGQFSNLPNENENFPPLYRSWREIDEENDAVRLDLAQEEMDIFEGWLGLGWDVGISTSESTRTEEGFIAVTGPLSGVLGDEPADLFISPAFSMVGSAEAERSIDALYLSQTVKLFDKLKITFGGRYEEFLMTTNGNTDLSDQRSLVGSFRSLTTVTDPSAVAIASALNLPDSIPADASELIGELEETNWYPALQASFAVLEGLRFKGSYSKTAVRPSFKEFAPVLVVDTDSGDIDGGNPYLQLSEVESFDLRVEYFRDNGDLFAVSAFTKDIQDPIEFIVIDTVDTPVTFAFNNSGGAQLKGLELEFNKSLDFIPYMDGISIGGNYAYIDAEATVSESERAAREASDSIGIIAPETRKLVEQPEFILNLNVSYNYEPWGVKSTLSYNRVSDVLKSVGGRDKYDRVERENGKYRLTFSKEFENGFKMRFSIKNLFEQNRESVLVDPLTGQQQGVERRSLGSRSYSIIVSKEF